eukprot:scaffold98640_cov33-Tisochrysis_lutea.AAC.3
MGATAWRRRLCSCPAPSRSPRWLDGSLRRKRGGLESLQPAPSLLDLSPPSQPPSSPPHSRLLRVCLLGPTNAGKSSLLNALIEAPVAAVSEKIHMTRVNTLGYLTDSNAAAQIEFIDAPGCLGPNVPTLRRAIWDALAAADLAFVVVDAAELSRPSRSTQRTKAQIHGFLEQLSAELDSQEARAAEHGASTSADGGSQGAEQATIGVAERVGAADGSDNGEARAGHALTGRPASELGATSITGEAERIARAAGGREGDASRAVWQHERHRPLGPRTLTALVLNKVRGCEGLATGLALRPRVMPLRRRLSTGSWLRTAPAVDASICSILCLLKALVYALASAGGPRETQGEAS